MSTHTRIHNRTDILECKLILIVIILINEWHNRIHHAIYVHVNNIAWHDTLLIMHKENTNYEQIMACRSTTIPSTNNNRSMKESRMHNNE